MGKKMAPSLYAKALTEFIGTGFLCLSVTMSVGLSMPLAGIGIGSTLACMIYMGGHISGGHLNPAVTTGALVRGALTGTEAAVYVFAQCLGGAAFGTAAWVWEAELPHGPGFPKRNESVTAGCAFLCEFVFTFALSHTMLHTGTTDEAKGKSYFGIAIGFVVLCGAVSVGGISGGCFNPAVSMLCLINGSFGDLWIYWTAPISGGLLAGFFFKTTATLRAHNHHVSIFDIFNAPVIIEFVGTFMLCFTVSTAAAPCNSQLGYTGDPLASFAIGSMLMCMVYAGGYISGGHFNPAVSIGVFVREIGPLATKPFFQAVLDLLQYLVAQVCGALLAGFVGTVAIQEIAMLKDGTITTIGFPYPEPGVVLWKAALAELFGTFALVFTVLNTATTKSTSENSFFGFAIGFVLMAMLVAMAKISGGAFNPAVGLLAVPSAASHIDHIWIYWAADPLAGFLAGVIYRFQNEDEFRTREEAQELKALMGQESEDGVHMQIRSEGTSPTSHRSPGLGPTSPSSLAILPGHIDSRPM